jgi:hypothetical protein
MADAAEKHHLCRRLKPGKPGPHIKAGGYSGPRRALSPYLAFVRNSEKLTKLVRGKNNAKTAKPHKNCG